MLVKFIKFDDEPTKEDILEALERNKDELFDSKHNGFACSDWIAEDILGQKHIEWEMFDEDTSVFIVIIEDKEKQKFHVFEVSPYFSLEFGATEVFLDDEDE